jgi:lysophospholipase L1-like esterase
VTAATPAGPAALALELNASIAALDCESADGISRHVEGEPPPPGLERCVWAGLVALLGLLCLSGWWASLADRPIGAAARVAALIACATLVVGMPLVFRARNAERGAVPDPCALEAFAQPAPRVVEPGAAWAIGDRRDGDFRLSAEVTLLEGTALDVLVRAGLPRVDRQLLVTLSTDPALPSGVGRNLGTFLETEPADGELARLPAGRPLRLEIECRDERLQASVDGRPLGAARDLDLRAGATALHALSGSARIADLRIEPQGQPASLARLIDLRALALGAGALVALILLAGPFRMRWAALAWAWPLAAVVVPMTPEEAVWFAACAAALLLLPLLVRAAARAPVPALLAAAISAALVGGTTWALLERPAGISPAILNRLRDSDIGGDPVPAAYAWARHPVCRRFNPYLRAQQYRDKPYTVAKPPGLRRLVALGSSSTYGYGVAGADAWAARLEALLAAGGARLEVVNAGVPGGTAERLRYFLGSVLLPLHPDVLIVSLSFNDRSIGGVIDERAHFRAMTTRGIGPLERLLARWSAARSEAAYGDYTQALARGEPLSDDDRERFTLAPARRFQDALRDMAEACRAAGTAIVFVEEPQRPGNAGASLAEYHEAIEALGRELGAPVVAPQAALDAAPGATFLDAVHPTQAGHLIIAREIAKALYAAGLAGR